MPSTDIILLYEIVRLGESLYPTLPERDRLPTNALFQAAEQVLPQYGYDPENAPSHIARFIFKIGGQRTGETLTDKFHAVLTGMNINLEYIPSSPYHESPAGRPTSRRALLQSDDETGGFDFGPRRISHRRYSSVSRTVESPLGPSNGDYDLPSRSRTRPRSASFEELFASPGDTQQHNRDAHVQQQNNEMNAIPQRRPAGVRLPLSQVQHSSRRATTAQTQADEEGDDLDDNEGLHIQRFRPRAPLVGNATGFLSGLGNFRESRDGVENKGLRESPLIIPNVHLNRRAPRSEGSDGFRGANDATVQTEDEQDIRASPYDPPDDDIEELEVKMDHFRNLSDGHLIKLMLFDWGLAARLETKTNATLQRWAVEFDHDDMRAEALDIWHEAAVSKRDGRLRDAAEKEHAEWVETMERRANRVYQLVTLQSVFIQWQDCAHEEAERTAVARRHLVRKRAFDGWRAQHVEDEAKVKNFVLIHALQKWSQRTLHHQVRSQVAVQRYEVGLAADALSTMYRVRGENVAGDFRIFKDIDDCLNTWLAKMHRVQAENEVAVTLDERLVLDEVLTIWGEETEDLQIVAHHATVELWVQDCRRKLQHWYEQARLTRLLRHYKTGDCNNLIRRALDTWRTASVDTRSETELADVLFLDDPFQFWRNEAKVRSFRAKVEVQEKQTALMHWAREERLAWYLRYSETKFMRDALCQYLAESQHFREMRMRSEHNADYVVEYYTHADTVHRWVDQTEIMWRHQQNASLVNIYRTTRPVLESWRENHHLRLVRDAYYGREADRQARRCRVLNVLDHWPLAAEAARRERMMTALRRFRREYKVSLAQSCIDKWLSSTFVAMDSTERAVALQIQHVRDEIHGYLQHWQETAATARALSQGAADGEIETFFSMWQDRVYDLQELQEFAVQFDANHVLGECFRKWEFPAFQMESQRRVVAAVLNRNENRLCREVLDDWLQRTNPNSTHFDLLQFSTRSRRSVRHPLQAPMRQPGFLRTAEQTESPLITLASSSRPDRTRPQFSGAPQTPRVPLSQLRFSRAASTAGTRGQESATRTGGLGLGASRFGTSIGALGAMPEFDEEESLLPGTEANDPAFMSTPTRWTGSARPLNYVPTTTPSAVLPSPFERELRREYGRSTTRRVGFSDIQEESLEEE